jgi:osmotically-inducible protein OsmY
MSRNLSLICASFVIACLLSGCWIAVATSAAAGAAVVYDRRSTGTVIDDQNIEFKIRHSVATFKPVNLQKNTHLSVTSYNNAVLLVGQVPDEVVKEKIGALAADTDQVRKVYNQLQIMPPTSLTQRSKDSWITAKIKSNSIFGREIDPLRTKVITENNVVYLMGIVSHEEAEKLTNVARKTNGVERVIRVFDYNDYGDDNNADKVDTLDDE